VSAAHNGFAKFGDFEGESTDAKHKGWSLMQSFSAPLSRATGGFEQSERALGATAVGNAVVVKELDSASVKIQKACVTGQKIAKVKVEMCTTLADGLEPFLAYEFENVIVTGYDVDVFGQPPTERITFTYTKVTWTYTKFGATGASQGKVTDSYSIGAGGK
jgi:type VI secretion system Hcp family effector